MSWTIAYSTAGRQPPPPPANNVQVILEGGGELQAGSLDPNPSSKTWLFVCPARLACQAQPPPIELYHDDEGMYHHKTREPLLAA